LSLSDDIRDFVIATYLEPARRRGDKIVSVRAGDVHREMHFTDRIPAVCAVLRGRPLADKAGVRYLKSDGPENSTTTVFSFDVTEIFSVAAAEVLLNDRFGPPIAESDKMVSFALSDGRHISLQRDVQQVQVWLEGIWHMPGSSGETTRTYQPSEGRHSNLSPRLSHDPAARLRDRGFPTMVTRARLNSKAEFNQLLDRYQAHASTTSSAMLTKPQEKASMLMNRILSGPPGTGKTYATAKLAVEICDGSASEDRAALMVRYRELVDRRRIAFVTFHQSYSYEEFVEGLRPETSSNSEDDGAVPTGGFRLAVRHGIFRQMCALAHENRWTGGKVKTLDSSRRVFKMALGNSAIDEQDGYFENAIAGAFIALGWGGDTDWSSTEFATFQAIKKKWQEIEPVATGKSPNIEMMTTFRVEMQVGDYVIVSDGRDRFRAIGEIVGDYYFDAAADYHPHRRKVRWLWVNREGQPRDLIYGKRFRLHTTYELQNHYLSWPALDQFVQGYAEVGSGPPQTYVLIIDEINRANISKVFGELITLIEPNKRLGMSNELTVALPYSGDRFGVPSNLHIIGTMNTADRSIALLDTALRRRFDFLELLPRPDLLPEDVDGINLRAMLSNLNDRIECLFDRDHVIGHAYLLDCTTRADVDAAMRQRIIPLLAEYFFEDWEKIRQVLGESADEGAFVGRTRLLAPAGLGLEQFSDRWRYTIKESFPDIAYRQLGA
jgi:5-methylcytosine-specific restriction protein B